MNPFGYYAEGYYAEVPAMCQITGKELTGTWWGDFRVGAEVGGLQGIQDTYDNGLELAKSDKVLGTEFSLVLNWLCWFYHEKDEKKSKLFEKLWHEFDSWVLENWSDEWRAYYLTETD